MIASHEAEACRQLWVSVLLLAMRELFGSDPNGLAAQQARNWIGTRDFREVCALAGFDWARVERALQRREAQRRRIAEKRQRADVALVTLATMEIHA